MMKIVQKLRASFTSPIGLVGYVVGLQSLFIRLIRWLGDMDFIASYWRPIGTFLDTGWGTLASVVVGAIIVAIAIFRSSSTPQVGRQIGRQDLETLPSREENSGETVEAEITALDRKIIENVGVFAVEKRHEGMFTVFHVEWEHNHLSHDNPQIVLHFWARNSHFHNVKLKEVKGHFKFNGEDLPGEIEFRNRDQETVTYGETSAFSIRQWIPPNSARKILGEDRHISLDLQFIELWATAINPRTTQALRSFRVSMPSSLQFDKERRWELQPAYVHQSEQN